MSWTIPILESNVDIESWFDNIEYFTNIITNFIVWYARLYCLN